MKLRPQVAQFAGTRRWRRSDRGSGSILIVGVMAVVMALAVAGICVAGYLAAAHQARAAADLAALSGAVAVRAGQGACAAASRTVRANHAEIGRCERVGDQVDFVVTVEAEVQVRSLLPGLPQTVAARAYAGPGGS